MSKSTTPTLIATRHGLEIDVVVRHLKRSGVRPVTGRRDIGIEIFRAAHVPNFETAEHDRGGVTPEFRTPEISRKANTLGGIVVFARWFVELCKAEAYRDYSRSQEFSGEFVDGQQSAINRQAHGQIGRCGGFFIIKINGLQGLSGQVSVVATACAVHDGRTDPANAACTV